jgi:transcription initiation factor TFIIE subunit alpha
LKKSNKASLNKISKLIEETFGKDALKVFLTLYRSSVELTDDKIASLCRININEVRRLLYKLSEHGLVTSRRIRDRNTSYYIYFWRINHENINQILIARKKMVLEKLKSRLSYEKTNQYICEKCEKRYNFDDAFSYEFLCPECGNMLEYIDNNNIIKNLESLIGSLEKELNDDERKLYRRSH